MICKHRGVVLRKHDNMSVALGMLYTKYVGKLVTCQGCNHLVGYPCYYKEDRSVVLEKFIKEAGDSLIKLKGQNYASKKEPPTCPVDHPEYIRYIRETILGNS